MRTLRRALALSSVSFLSLAVPAYAQDAASSSETPTATSDDSVILVTARRREEALQDVPVVINAVTAQTLEKLDIRNATDITSVVPGLSLVVNANGIGTSSSMRGVNHDVNASGENGTIQYYLNDAPVPSSLVLQTMFDVGQIEVEHGPQGTLRGRSVPSGSIAITTTQPNLSEAGGFVDGTAATKSVADVKFGVNVPIIEDKLAVRVAGLYDFNRGNQVTSINNPTKPTNRSEGIRTTVRFEPVDFLKLGFTYTGFRHEFTGFDQDISFSQLDPTFTPSVGAADFGTITADQRKSIEAFPQVSTQVFHAFGWNAKLSFAGQNLFYVGSRTNSTYNSDSTQDTGNQFPSLNPRQITVTKGTYTTHEVRLQNSDRILGMFDYVVGYFHQAQTTDTQLQQDQVLQPYLALVPPFATAITPLAPAGGAIETRIPISLPNLGAATEESFFGNLTLHLGDKTELSGGLRRIHYVDPGQEIFISGAAATPPTPINAHATIYNVTLRHRFNDSLMVYASTGSSWRPPINTIGDFNTAGYSPNERAHTSLPAETSKSYEIGFKSNLMDHKLTLDATFFHQDFTNYPYRAGTGIPYINTPASGVPGVTTFNFVSAVPVKINGVEGDIGFNPSKHFSLQADASYVKSKIGNTLLACNPTAFANPTVAQLQAVLGTEHLGVCPAGGQSATFLPKFSGSIQAEYSTTVSDRAEGFLRGLLTYKGSTANDPTNPYDDVGAYGILNLYAGLRDPKGGWTLTFYAKNINNVQKVLSVSSAAGSINETLLYLPFNPVTHAVTQVPAGTGSASIVSPYVGGGAGSGILMTPPREFGINLRIAFGSR